MLLALALTAALSSACKNAEGPKFPDHLSTEPVGCDHGIKSNAELAHTWPYPAYARTIRWGNERHNTGLKLRPREIAIRTATVRFDKGELIEPSDSHLVITKPRRLVAKHDMAVRRQVWDQGRLVLQVTGEIRAGDTVNFLFFDSGSSCLIDTDQGLSYVGCTLDDSFEGLTAEHPSACEQTWWLRVRLSKVDKGWFVFDPALMARLPAPARSDTQSAETLPEPLESDAGVVDSVTAE